MQKEFPYYLDFTPLEFKVAVRISTDNHVQTVNGMVNPNKVFRAHITVKGQNKSKAITNSPININDIMSFMLFFYFVLLNFSSEIISIHLCLIMDCWWMYSSN